MGLFGNKQVKRTAAELAAAKEASLDWERRHSKRPDPLVARRTAENVCRANGHVHGKGCR